MAAFLQEVSHDVKIEPALLELSENETVDFQRSANRANEARADVSCNGFWMRFQRAFFDIKVTNLLAPSYRDKSVATTLSDSEKQKKRMYNHRVMNIELGTFTPLILGATGGISRECSIFLSRLSDKISEKRNCKKSDVIAGIRRKISFILIRSVVACLRGERASRTFTPDQVTLKDPRMHEILTSVRE